MPVDSSACETRTALVLGATGLVGRALLQRLLDDVRYRKVCVLARGPVPQAHAKLEVTIAAFDALGVHASRFEADHVFCCLGTTLAQAGSRESFQHVDFGYVVEAARLAAQAGAGHFLWVSSIGADAHARTFYPRVKGEAEDAIAALPLARWTALRPSLLLGERDAARPGERIAAAVLTPLAPLMRGPLRRYRPIKAETVADAMIALAWDTPAPPGLEIRSGGSLPDDRPRRG